MIELLVTLIVVALVAGIFWWAVGALPFIPPPLGQGLRVAIVVVAALYMLSIAMGHSHGFVIGGRLP